MMRLARVFKVALLLGVTGSCWAAATPPDFGLDPMVQLVQSVPIETDLAHPNLPMTADVWVDMIKNAKSTIDLAQFYISSRPHKSPLEPVLEELENAAKRGVRIRLLLSQSLLNEDRDTFERFKKIRGASIRVYDMAKLSGGVHHAKYWVVDRREVFLGSQNFDWRSLNQIHELGVRVQDPTLAAQLGRIFDLDWRIAFNDEFPTPMMLTTLARASALANKVELVASPPTLNMSDVRSSIRVLIDLIEGAKKSLKVQLLDYSPTSSSQDYWPELDNALRAAAARGVKIQMLVSSGGSALKAMDHLRSLNVLPNIEVKKVTIPQSSGGPIPFARLIHSKYMILDDSVFWIGTSNWSKGYFYNSRNVELVFHRPDLAQGADQIFQKLWNHSFSESVDKKAGSPSL